MSVLGSVKEVLERNAEQLRRERGFFAETGYAINQTLADLTPDTAYGSAADHFRLAAASLGETLQAAAAGMKQVLWDGKERFVREIIDRSGVKNPAGQTGLATFYTGLFYLKAFTYDAVVHTAEGFWQSGQAIANAGGTEEALLGVSQLYASLAAAAGMAAGVSAAGKMTFTAPILHGPEAALATTANPAGLLAAAALPGGIGTVMMSVVHEERIGPVELVRESRKGLNDAIRKGDFDEIAEWTRDIYFALGPDALADYAHAVVRLALLELRALENFVRRMLNRRLTPADWEAFNAASRQPHLPLTPGDSTAEFWATFKQSVSQGPSN